MHMSRKKPPLTPEDIAEKDRLNALVEASKPEFKEKHGKRLTQTLLAEVVGEMVKGEPMTQGAIWQYLKSENPTKLNAPIVQAIAAVCDFDPELVSPRFAPKEWLRPGESIGGLDDLPEDEAVELVERWAAQLPPRLAMKMAQIFLSRASAEL